MLFVVYKPTYNSIDRVRLYEVMKFLKIPRKLINIVKMSSNELLNKVALGKYLYETFMIMKESRWGDPLSTMLFNSTEN